MAGIRRGLSEKALLFGKDDLTKAGKGSDPRLQVLGMKRDEAISLFGVPGGDPNGGSITGNSWLDYTFSSSDGKRMEMMLFCPRPPEVDSCDQLRLLWFDTDKL